MLFQKLLEGTMIDFKKKRVHQDDKTIMSINVLLKNASIYKEDTIIKIHTLKNQSPKVYEEKN